MLLVSSLMHYMRFHPRRSLAEGPFLAYYYLSMKDWLMADHWGTLGLFELNTY